MSILELPDREFLNAYLRIVAVRFPTKSERRRYENLRENYPRISKEEHANIIARLAKYDKKVRISRKKNRTLKDGEGSKVDWGRIEEEVFETKRDFEVPLLVDGEETKWPVTAFSMKEARSLAMKAAYDTGAQFVSLIK